jgi:hypothetical protein
MLYTPRRTSASTIHIMVDLLSLQVRFLGFALVCYGARKGLL